jgi:hypothetical protein
MRSIRVLALALSVAAAACSQTSAKYPTTTDETLKLSRVFLYRNGIGYFEREGHVEGDLLRIRVRKDQINDLLKSLTVVNRKGGQAVSISMPLDPQTWANAALATLAPGRGNLAQVLDTLRGTYVKLDTTERNIEGRIVMVEEITDEPDPSQSGRPDSRPQVSQHDHRITLMEGNEMNVVRLSKVQGVTFKDGDLSMQIHRSLDASAGEGMFQQVDVSIRLTGANSHDLAVSYVVPAPMWKPTYRVVLPKEGKGKALLQGWAVVDNTSGEDWRAIKLGLTSGAPIAFRYDLHTPRDVERSDLTETGVRKRASVAVGETTYKDEPAPTPAATATAAPTPEAPMGGAYAAAEAEADESTVMKKAEDKARYRGPKGSAAAAPKPDAKPATGRSRATRGGGAYPAATTAPAQQAYAAPRDEPAAPPPAVDADSLRRSTLAQARAAAVSGLTRFDIEPSVTVPDGASTMVAVINQEVDGEETFLFRPGGAGYGYEANPYRVVRFKNSTPFVLESGPIAIYAGGSFVGEGLSEAVGAGTSATIPFAVEPGIMVTSTSKYDGDEMRLLKIVRGVLEVESFSRRTTEWNVKSQTPRQPFTVLVRHSKAGYNYELIGRGKNVEDLPDAYLIPIEVPQGKQEGAIKVVEQTPSRFTISIWEHRAIGLLDKLMLVTNVPEARAKLEPIVRKRQEIGKLDTKIEELKAQRTELDQRANETRHNLDAIQKDAAAAALRGRLTKRLEQFTNDGDKVGREIVELQNKRMEMRIELEDALQNFDYTAPVQPQPKP